MVSVGYALAVGGERVERGEGPRPDRAAEGGELAQLGDDAVIALAPAAVSVPMVAWELMAAVKAGSALSVAVIAASYACRLAGEGWNR